MLTNKLAPFIILVIGIAILINSCDTSSPPVGNENLNGKQEQFFAYTDTASPLIYKAVSIFRDRNKKENFVKHFLDKKGLPAWDFSSSFTRDKKQILLIPVRQPNVEKVTGVYYFSFDKQGKRLEDDWIPRDYEGKWIDKRALETIILGYEQRLFGKKYTDEGARIFNKENISKMYNGVLSKAPSVEQGQCYTSCVSYYCGDWECEYYIDWGQEDEWVPAHGGGGSGSTGSFYGTIEVDETIKRNDLTNCVYSKLNSSSTFTELISKFEGGSSNFNLRFELTEVDGNDFGALTGTLPDFIAQIDASRLSSRNGLEVAGTFLHEAMHVEMRRYLYRQEVNTGSTIPGFPGSFTEDWNNYVKEKTGGVGAAEHEAMAQNFINFIAGGLEEFDNSQLDLKYYRAIAWDGLLQTNAWNYADQNEIGANRNDNIINERPQKCSR